MSTVQVSMDVALATPQQLRERAAQLEAKHKEVGLTMPCCLCRSLVTEEEWLERLLPAGNKRAAKRRKQQRKHTYFRFYIGSHCQCEAMVCLPCGREARVLVEGNNLSCPNCRTVNERGFPSSAYIPKEDRKEYQTIKMALIKQTVCRDVWPISGTICLYGNCCRYAHQVPNGTVVQQHSPQRNVRGITPKPDPDGPSPKELVPTRHPRLRYGDAEYLLPAMKLILQKARDQVSPPSAEELAARATAVEAADAQARAATAALPWADITLRPGPMTGPMPLDVLSLIIEDARSQALANIDVWYEEIRPREILRPAGVQRQVARQFWRDLFSPLGPLPRPRLHETPRAVPFRQLISQNSAAAQYHTYALETSPGGVSVLRALPPSAAGTSAQPVPGPNPNEPNEAASVRAPSAAPLATAEDDIHSDDTWVISGAESSDDELDL